MRFCWKKIAMSDLKTTNKKLRSHTFPTQLIRGKYYLSSINQCKCHGCPYNVLSHCIGNEAGDLDSKIVAENRPLFWNLLLKESSIT